MNHTVHINTIEEAQQFGADYLELLIPGLIVHREGSRALVAFGFTLIDSIERLGLEVNGTSIEDLDTIEGLDVVAAIEDLQERDWEALDGGIFEGYPLYLVQAADPELIDVIERVIAAAEQASTEVHP